jgi:hypothetical protein
MRTIQSYLYEIRQHLSAIERTIDVNSVPSGYLGQQLCMCMSAAELAEAVAIHESEMKEMVNANH